MVSAHHPPSLVCLLASMLRLETYSAFVYACFVFGFLFSFLVQTSYFTLCTVVILFVRELWYIVTRSNTDTRIHLSVLFFIVSALSRSCDALLFLNQLSNR